jgi:anti-sigma regulatory factor (Ser/Thr protein kinase)
MEAHQQAAANGHGSLAAESVGLRALRVAYERQAQVIDTLTQSNSRLRTATIALESDNTDLRGEIQRLRGVERVRGTELAQWVDLRLGVDVHAPVVARAALVGTVGEQVSAPVLERAQLVTSELVTNSVVHCGASPSDALMFRVHLSTAVLRLEVDDPGRGGMIAQRPPDLANGGGFGLHVVDTMSESWGVERSSAGTRVWAHLALAA